MSDSFIGLLEVRLQRRPRHCQAGFVASREDRVAAAAEVVEDLTACVVKGRKSVADASARLVSAGRTLRRGRSGVLVELDGQVLRGDLLVCLLALGQNGTGLECRGTLVAQRVGRLAQALGVVLLVTARRRD